MHFCNSTDRVLSWIENHGFGDQYPKYHLPINACVHKQASPEQDNLLCSACERVIDVEIDRGECLPQFKVLHPGSLQERCLYLADVIGNRKEELKKQFKEQLCPCLGCCGNKKCLFRNREEGWLTSLIETVTNKVSAQLESEGWATGRHPPAYKF
jgi:hypothetical protein